MKKKWYESKTLWVNAVAFAAVIAQVIVGKEVLDPSTQTIILSGINFVLRVITKHEINWKEGE